MHRVNNNFLTIEDYIKTTDHVRNTLHASMDLDELFNKLLKEASNAVCCDSAVISLRCGNEWTVEYFYGLTDSVIGTKTSDDEERHGVLAITGKQPVIIHDASTDDRVNKAHLQKENIKSVIVIPLFTKNKVLGAAFFYFHEKPQMFNKYAKEFIKTLFIAISTSLQIVFELEARKSALDKYKSEVEDHLKIQDEIFVNVSHELKTPLNVIFSSSQFLEAYLKNKNSKIREERALNSIKIINQNCYRFTKLINNITDSSKLESGFFKLNLHNQNIVGIIGDTIKSITDFIKSKELDIIFESNAKEKYIACDSEKIERVILNLISNAIKFSDKGNKIYIRITEIENSVEIAVQDTGIGIEEKDLESISNKFFQADKSLSRNAEGSGIGLFIVKSIIKLHGGNFTIESQVGKGTTVKFTLPDKLTDTENHPIIINNRADMIKIELSDVYNL